MMPPFMQQISITYRCAMRFREKELEDTGLAGCQTPYLTALCRRPGITQEELSRELNVNKSSVTRQLLFSEAHGAAVGNRNLLHEGVHIVTAFRLGQVKCCVCNHCTPKKTLLSRVTEVL